MILPPQLATTHLASIPPEPPPSTSELFAKTVPFFSLCKHNAINGNVLLVGGREQRRVSQGTKGNLSNSPCSRTQPQPPRSQTWPRLRTGVGRQEVSRPRRCQSAKTSTSKWSERRRLQLRRCNPFARESMWALQEPELFCEGGKGILGTLSGI